MNVVSFVQNNDSLFFMKFKCSMAFLVRRHYLCMCVCVCNLFSKWVWRKLQFQNTYKPGQKNVKEKKKIKVNLI